MTLPSPRSALSSVFGDQRDAFLAGAADEVVMS
jgi:hypothetical protein